MDETAISTGQDEADISNTAHIEPRVWNAAGVQISEDSCEVGQRNMRFPEKEERGEALHTFKSAGSWEVPEE